MLYLIDLPDHVLHCLSQYFTDFENFENFFYTCKLFYEFGKDPVVRLRLLLNYWNAKLADCREKVNDTIFVPFLQINYSTNPIPRTIRILLSAEEVCSIIVNSTNRTYPFELLPTAWYFSSLSGYNTATTGFVKNYEKILDRLSNSDVDFLFPFENDLVGEEEPWILLSILAAHGLKTAILNNDVEIARTYLTSDFVCAQITKLLSYSNARPGMKLSPLLDTSCLSHSFMKELLDRIPAFLSVSDDQGHSPLHYAVQTRNLHPVQLLLTYEQTNIMAMSNDRLNSLHEACKIGNNEILETICSMVLLDSEQFRDLARYCIDNNYSTSLIFLITSPKVQHGFTDFYSLLQRAVANDNASAAEFLISACPSALSELRNTKKATDLFVNCAECRSIKFATLLVDLDLSEKLNHQDESRRTPLYCARNRAEIAKLYLKHGANPFIELSDGRTVYHHWFKTYHESISEIIDMVIELFSGSINVPERDGLTALGITIDRFDASTVDKLLSSGADPQLLMFDPSSLDYSNFPPAKVLARAKPDVAFHIFTSLLEFGMDPNTVVLDDDDAAKSLIHLACKANTKNVVKALLAYGADPYILDSNDATTISVVADNLEFTELLINGISELEAQEIREAARDRFKDSVQQPRPMFSRYENSSRDDNELLPIFINQQDIEGNTALHKSSPEVSEYLLLLYADVNVQNFKGDTVLHNKIRDGVLSAIVGILKFYPDLSIKNFNGLTPCQLALSLGLEEDHWLVGALNGENDVSEEETEEILPWNILFGFNF